MARQNKTTEVTMHSLDVTEGKMKSKYNRPKRFLGALFRKILLPSLIVAGVAVGAFALIPALSTAVSLTFANAALIGAAHSQPLAHLLVVALSFTRRQVLVVV